MRQQQQQQQQQQWNLVVIVRWMAVVATFGLVAMNLQTAFQQQVTSTSTEIAPIAPMTTSSSSSSSSWNPSSSLFQIFQRKKTKSGGTIFVQRPKLIIRDNPWFSPTNSADNNQTTTATTTATTLLFLVHVGKTGGETVRQTLEVTCRMRANPVNRKACLDSFRQNPVPSGRDNNGSVATSSSTTSTTSLLSKHTIGAIHCGVSRPSTAMAHATTFLWTLRNPIDRVTSWFRYTNPANCQIGGNPQDALKALHPQQRKQRKQQQHVTGKDQEQEQALAAAAAAAAAAQSTACHVNRSITNHRNKWGTKFFGCFSTVNDFAMSLAVAAAAATVVVVVEVSLSSDHDKQSSIETATTLLPGSNCSKLAWRTILGQAPQSNHLYYNHGYYWNQTMALYPTKENWIIRTESLWDDVQQANDLLSITTTATTATATTTAGTMDQKGHGPFWHNITHGSDVYKTNTPRDVYLSPLAVQYLCCALMDELDIYKRLIQRATNLLPHQKESTLLRLEQQCPNDHCHSK